MDPCQLDRPFYSPSMSQICWWQESGQNGVWGETIVQGGRELLHCFSTLQRGGGKAVTGWTWQWPWSILWTGEWRPCYFCLRANLAYLGDSTFNNDTAKDDCEWVLNKDVSFDYSCCLDVPETIYSNSLHMPISIMMKAFMYIEDGDIDIFIVLRSQEDQLSIIFGRIHSRVSTSVVSDEDLKPPQFFHYAWSTRHMMKRMRYNLSRGEGLNFEKGRRVPLQPFILKRKVANNYN